MDISKNHKDELFEQFSEDYNRLQQLQAKGEGRIIKLDEVNIGGKTCPLGAFTSSDEPLLLLTSGHETWGVYATDETLYYLAEKGVKDTVYVPVADPELFPYSKWLFRRWSAEYQPYLVALYLRHNMVGSSRYFAGGGLDAKSHKDFDYEDSEPSPTTVAIQRLVNSVKIVVDFTNSVSPDYTFLCKLPTGRESEQIQLFQKVREVLHSRGLEPSTDILSPICREIFPGLQEYLGNGSIMNFAANLGKLNLTVYVPFMRWSRKGRPCLMSKKNLLEVNAYIVRSLIDGVRR